ncbi:Hsp20/alpha crystallin family protein [Ferroglobus placidus]|uniref:Hsp20/alpha crystallin family protein n=1 Tax=Ferroglobus placidus TaxID=54261 RepID=UPI000693E3CC|nr:CS domain-containing protein [Ferroglobus placidus]
MVCPDVFVSHDEKDENLLIDVFLPGAEKETIRLSFTKSGFCVEARDENRDITYFGCFTLAHEVFPDKAKAKFENGVLRITVPFKKEETFEIKVE